MVEERRAGGETLPLAKQLKSRTIIELHSPSQNGALMLLLAALVITGKRLVKVHGLFLAKGTYRTLSYIYAPQNMDRSVATYGVPVLLQRIA